MAGDDEFVGLRAVIAGVESSPRWRVAKGVRPFRLVSGQFILDLACHSHRSEAPGTAEVTPRRRRLRRVLAVTASVVVVLLLGGGVVAVRVYQGRCGPTWVS